MISPRPASPTCTALRPARRTSSGAAGAGGRRQQSGAAWSQLGAECGQSWLVQLIPFTYSSTLSRIGRTAFAAQAAQEAIQQHEPADCGAQRQPGAGHRRQRRPPHNFCSVAGLRQVGGRLTAGQWVLRKQQCCVAGMRRLNLLTRAIVLMCRLVAYGEGLFPAIANPRLHHQLTPNSL